MVRFCIRGFARCFLPVFLLSVPFLPGAEAGRYSFVFGDPRDTVLQERIPQLARALRDRGHSVAEVDGYPSPDEILGALERRGVGSGDDVLLLFYCHGSTLVRVSDPSVGHIMCCTAAMECMTVPKLRRLVMAIQAKGARVTVLDGSCGGGATLTGLGDLPDLCVITGSSPIESSRTGLDHVFGFDMRWVETYEDVATWWQVWKLSQLPRFEVFERVFHSGCYGRLMDFRASLWEMAGSLGTRAFVRSPLSVLLEDTGAARADANAVQSQLANSCILETQTRHSFTRLLSSLMDAARDGASLSDREVIRRVGSIYARMGVPFTPRRPVASFQDLVREVDGRIEGIHALRDQEAQVVASLDHGLRSLRILEGAEDAREGGPPAAPAAGRRVSRVGRLRILRSEIAQYRRQLRELQAGVRRELDELNPLLTAVEQMSCMRAAVSPCRGRRI